MSEEQRALLRDFIDGLQTGVHLQVVPYNPECMDWDGIVEHVPGIAVRAIDIDPMGGYWHAGVCLVPLAPDQSRHTLLSEVNAFCRGKSWIEGFHPGFL